MTRNLQCTTRSHSINEGQCLHPKAPFVVNLHGKFCMSLCTGMARTMNPHSRIEKSNPAFSRPKLPLHCQYQSNPAEYWRDGGHNAKRPRPAQMEHITRAAGGECQQQQPLTKPGQGPRAICLLFPDLASHPFKSALHIALRYKCHGLSLVSALRYVHYIQ